MKRCECVEKELVAFLHGELSERRSVAVKKHLEDCSGCRAEVERHRVTLNLLNDVLEVAPSVERLHGSHKAIRYLAERRITLSDIWSNLQFRSFVGAGALATLFIMIAGSLVVFKTIKQRSSGPIEVAMQQKDSEEPQNLIGEQLVHSGLDSMDFNGPMLATLSMPTNSITYQEFVRIYQEKSESQMPQVARSGLGIDLYDPVVENRFQVTADKPLSSFGLDVNRTAYADIRRFLDGGKLPPAHLVRTEELINRFDYNYPLPQEGDPFSISLEVGPCPWNEAHQLARIGLQGSEVDLRGAKPNNLVFLVDISGSMSGEDKLPLLKDGLRLMTDQLRPQDSVSIVAYAGDSGVLLEPTNDKQRIHMAIDQLMPSRSVAEEFAGIEQAYQLARTKFVVGGNNRVILATDGDLNVGGRTSDGLVQFVANQRASGIYLSVLGLGSVPSEQGRMAELVAAGAGAYDLVEGQIAARASLVRAMGGTYKVLAQAADVQVEFNPAQVKEYRLIGYDNYAFPMLGQHALDRPDDLGAGHAVTALYELVATAQESSASDETLKYQRTEYMDSDELFTVKMQYTLPEQQERRSLVRSVSVNDFSASPSDSFRFAGEVAEFALLLRDSSYKADASYDRVIEQTRALSGADSDGARSEFVQLVEKARSLVRSARL